MNKGKKPLKDIVYDYIVELMMEGTLKPGDKVPETSIASHFNISRAPVRDAMKQLENEGLLEIYPKRFAQVAEYDRGTVQSIGLMRIFLDSIAIKLALLYASRMDFLELKKIAEACDHAKKDDNFVDRVKYDAEFHLLLSKISNNSILLKFQRELNARVQFIICYYPNMIKHTETPINEHIAIAEALLNHDEQTALTISAHHLRTFYNIDDALTASLFNGLESNMVGTDIKELSEMMSKSI